MTEVIDSSTPDVTLQHEEDATQMSMIDVEDDNTRESTQSSMNGGSGEGLICLYYLRVIVYRRSIA